MVYFFSCWFWFRVSNARLLWFLFTLPAVTGFCPLPEWQPPRYFFFALFGSHLLIAGWSTFKLTTALVCPFPPLISSLPDLLKLDQASPALWWLYIAALFGSMVSHSAAMLVGAGTVVHRETAGPPWLHGQDHFATWFAHGLALMRVSVSSRWSCLRLKPQLCIIGFPAAGSSGSHRVYCDYSDIVSL